MEVIAVHVSVNLQLEIHFKLSADGTIKAGWIADLDLHVGMAAKDATIAYFRPQIHLQQR